SRRISACAPIFFVVTSARRRADSSPRTTSITGSREYSSILPVARLISSSSVSAAANGQTKRQKKATAAKYRGRATRRRLLGRLGVLLLLGDARRLAAATAQVIELRAAHLAAAYDLDRVDERRVEREHALDAFAVGNLAHREALVEAAARARDA